MTDFVRQTKAEVAEELKKLKDCGTLLLVGKSGRIGEEDILMSIRINDIAGCVSVPKLIKELNDARSDGDLEPVRRVELSAVVIVQAKGNIRAEDILALEQHLNSIAAAKIWQQLQLGVRVHVGEIK
ncbi:MAG: hypothetical protein M0R68_15300 [Bacteroidetes bacterium]|nr:hypothetical protein [Bacteroidota bacterium]